MKTSAKEQKKICQRWGAPFLPVDPSQKVGAAENIRQNVYPINGLRHLPIGDTSGWYIWAGDNICEDDDFFRPLHAAHLREWCPEVERYLGLAPGWRFLIAPHYEDVWFDESLLELQNYGDGAIK